MKKKCQQKLFEKNCRKKIRYFLVLSWILYLNQELSDQNENFSDNSLRIIERYIQTAIMVSEGTDELSKSDGTN